MCKGIYILTNLIPFASGRNLNFQSQMLEIMIIWTSQETKHFLPDFKHPDK